MDEVICKPEDVDPEWLTGILQTTTSICRVEVEAVRVTLCKELPWSTVARLGIEYSSPVPLPSELFLKIIGHETVGSSPASEVEFYRRLAPKMDSPPIIPCYYAASSAELGYSNLVLADLSESHSQPDQNDAPTKAETIRAMEALARCHARNWDLVEGAAEPLSRAELTAFVLSLENNVADFLSMAVNDLPAKQRLGYDLMVSNADRIWGRLTRRKGLTVTHGDCHWWNFLFPNYPSSSDVYVFDWHLWHADLGVRDLAFLVALGGFAEPRPEIESELLRRYHAALQECGVSDYSFRQMFNDYRWSAIRNLNIPVIFWSQGKHPFTWRTALRRAFEAYERLRCEELLA